MLSSHVGVRDEGVVEREHAISDAEPEAPHEYALAPQPGPHRDCRKRTPLQPNADTLAGGEVGDECPGVEQRRG